MNWNRTRSWFPVTDEIIYLNHAGVAPISTRVADALNRYTRSPGRKMRRSEVHRNASLPRDVASVVVRWHVLI